MPQHATILLPLVMVAAQVSASGQAPMTAAEAMALPQPRADCRVTYADHEHAFADLRLPPGDGPHPVAIIVHGGCWLAEYDLGYMSALAAAITAEGVATWSIEYRRIGHDHGGWPGTFVDVAAAADQLRVLAPQVGLDLGRVVAIGHSAGGHLALWLAARSRLAADDPLRGANPLPLSGVLSLAGIPDLAAYTSADGCGASVPALLGGAPDANPDRLRRASPIELAPLGVPQVLLCGELDHIVPLMQAQSYARKAAEDLVSVRVVPGIGHFELADPASAAWPELRTALRELLDR